LTGTGATAVADGLRWLALLALGVQVTATPPLGDRTTLAGGLIDPQHRPERPESKDPRST
jgi:hypothetical protein